MTTLNLLYFPLAKGQTSEPLIAHTDVAVKAKSHHTFCNQIRGCGLLKRNGGKERTKQYSEDHCIQLKPLVPGTEPTYSRGALPSSLAVCSASLGSLCSGPQAARFLLCCFADCREHQSRTATAGSTKAGLPAARIPPSISLAASRMVIEDKEEGEDKENTPQKQKERSWSQTLGRRPTGRRRCLNLCDLILGRNYQEEGQEVGQSRPCHARFLASLPLWGKRWSNRIQGKEMNQFS